MRFGCSSLPVMEKRPHKIHFSTFFAVLTVVVIVSLLLLIYHCLGCNQRRRAANSPHRRHRPRQWFAPTEEPMTTTSSIENSITHLIPAYTYGEEGGLLSKGDETCAVCLCEFKDGESLRLMPECLHSFHVPCIDMWLNSHSNCPLCRTNMTPSPSPLPGCVQ